jgi:predicted nucleotidyltransferase
MVPERLLPDALVGPLADTKGLVSAYLFGSMATGRTHRESDVDVAVLLDWREYPAVTQRFDLRLRLSERLRGVAGRAVDLVILNDAPPQFARYILKHGRRLLVVEPARDHAYLRVTLSRAADLEPFLRRARAVKRSGLVR